MTELETMQRAKMYIDKMANGINPLTDKEIEEDDFVNNVRISRCLFYVSGILEKVINNGGVTNPKYKKNVKAPFPSELLAQYIYKEDATISRIIEQLYEPVANQNIKKISAVSIHNWLISCGILEERYDEKLQKTVRTVTEKGKQFGLRNEYISKYDGKEYHAIIYGKKAQENLIANFDKFYNGQLI